MGGGHLSLAWCWAPTWNRLSPAPGFICKEVTLASGEQKIVDKAISRKEFVCRIYLLQDGSRAPERPGIVAAFSLRKQQISEQLSGCWVLPQDPSSSPCPSSQGILWHSEGYECASTTSTTVVRLPQLLRLGSARLGVSGGLGRVAQKVKLHLTVVMETCCQALGCAQTREGGPISGEPCLLPGN